MLVAIDQLIKNLPNLEWVVVITWFATSTDAGACTIIPKVEFHGTTASAAGLSVVWYQPRIRFAGAEFRRW